MPSAPSPSDRPPGRRRFRRALTAAACAVAALAGASAAQAAPNEVLILESSVSGGLDSREARAVTALGLQPVLASDAVWRSLSAAQFDDYRALVIGDTGGNSTATFQAATDTASAWGPVADGNSIIIGTDPVAHGIQGGDRLVDNGIAFAVADGNRTGTYITLGDAYDGAGPNTAVPLLDRLAGGGFEVASAGCFDDAHIVAEHAALDGISDASLSNWGCSIHEGFDRWPGAYQVLAIARNQGSAFTASDGTVGTPYILAAGAGLRSFPLSLDPTAQTVPADSRATLTAQLLDAQTRLPVLGARISFRVSSGPNAGTSGVCIPLLCSTSAGGTVTWSYLGTAAGNDTVQAWLDRDGDGAPSPGEPLTSAGVSYVAPPPGRDYVSLGDSFSSGEGTFQYDSHREAQRCHRGPLGWPRLIQARTDSIARIEHRACTGATSADLLKRDRSGARQIPITPNTGVELVTLTVGGNDINFGDRVRKFFTTVERNGRSDTPGPGLSAGERRAFEKQLDDLYKRLRDKVYPEIAAAYPNARIVHVGYPQIAPAPDQTPFRCGWLSKREQRVAEELEQGLNGTIFLATETHSRVEYVSVTDILDGHELCTSDSWVVDLSIRGSTEKGHPDADGQGAYAQAVADAVGVTLRP